MKEMSIMPSDVYLNGVYVDPWEGKDESRFYWIGISVKDQGTGKFSGHHFAVGDCRENDIEDLI